MSWLLTNLVASFLLPPLNGLVPAFAGLLLLGRRPRLGRSLLAFGLLLLAALALPIVADALLRPLEDRFPPLPRETLARLDAEAVVILGAGAYRRAPEFAGADDVRQLALDRLRYGALLARESGRPVLVTGGAHPGQGKPEALAMEVALTRDFGIHPRWIEARAEDTRQNALYSAEKLLPQGLRRIALVTHAFHMPRAVAAFEAAGFQVVPAPTAFLATSRPRTLLDFLPRYEAMRNSGLALHELIGIAWYRLRR